MKSQDIIYEEFIKLPGSRQNETEFQPGQRGSCNHLKRSNVYDDVTDFEAC